MGAMEVLIPSEAIPVCINVFHNPSFISATEICHDGMSEERHRLLNLERRLSNAIDPRRPEYRNPISVNEIVAVRSPESHQWQRGRVAEYSQRLIGPMYKIYFIDYGTSRWLKPNEVREPPFKIYEDLQPQEMKLILQDIVPASMEISRDYASMSNEICSKWTPASANFVDQIKKNYYSAYFVEGSFPGNGLARFGDVLFVMKSDGGAVSLSRMLCDKGHAKLCKEEFCRRQEDIANRFAEMQSCPSPLQSRPSSASSSRCTSSPGPPTSGCSANSSSQDENAKRKHKTIAEFQEERLKKSLNSEKLNQSSKNVDVAQSSVMSSQLQSQEPAKKNEESSQQSTSKVNRLAMLAKLKKSKTSGSTLEKAIEPSSPEPLKSSSTNPESPNQRPSSNSNENSIFPDQPSPVPQILDSRFVPAGRPIKNEQKCKRNHTYDSSSSNESGSLRNMNSPSNGWHRPSGKFTNVSNQSTEFSKHINHSHHASMNLACSSSSDHSTDERPKRPVQPSSNSGCKRVEANSHLSKEVGVSSVVNMQPQERTLPTVYAKLSAAKKAAQNESLFDSESDCCLSSSSQKSDSENSPHPTMPTSSRSYSGKEVSSNSKPVESLRTVTSGDRTPDATTSLRDRLLRGAPAISQIDDVTSEEEYLTRTVLLHGGFLLKPWVSFNDLKSNFSSFIEQYLMTKKWCYSILTIEKYMWPAIRSRQNVVMISPPNSGKTSSYLMPLLDFLIDGEEAPRGNGPMVIILCSGSSVAHTIYSTCVRILSSLKKGPRVRVTSGPVLEKHFFIDLINGCDIFITTPPLLLRLMKEHKYTYAMNFHRLRHYVLDQADILFSRFLTQMIEIQALLVAEQERRGADLPIQTIVASEKWMPRFLDFAKNLLGDPCLFINDCFEACVYGKPDVFFHMTPLANKPSKLLNVLRSMAGLHKVIVFCEETEVEKLKDFLDNDCKSCLVACNSSSQRDIDAIQSLWSASRSGDHYILLCTDKTFRDIKIQDATYVVHYSLPEDRSFFVHRLGSIMKNLPNMLEKKKPITSPAIHIIMDQTNEEQVPVIVQLMQRISDKLDEQLIKLAEAEMLRKERKMKMNKPFCKILQMFGECWKKSDCPNRHVYISNLDSIDLLPRSGLMNMKVSKVHDACHFSVRLVEHISDDGTTKKWPSRYLELGALMSDYYCIKNERKLIDKVRIGDIFGVETASNLYQRIQVLEITTVDKRGNPTEVCAQFLEVGHHEILTVSCLLHLPKHLKDIPAQIVNVILCGLLPADQDETFGSDVRRCVEDWIKSTDSVDDKSQLIQGKIVLCMRNTLWVDPLNIIQYLPHTDTYVVLKNISKSLLNLGYAQENQSHIPKLLELFGESCNTSVPTLAAQSLTVMESQPSPSWAFLEDGVFDNVHFAAIEDPFHFFVQRTKFSELFKKLTKDIQKESDKLKKVNVSSLKPGYFCLAKHETDPGWHRVKVVSVNEDDSIAVFYGDYGDSCSVSPDDLKCIPDWALTKLPFQAIECSLAGISSCDSIDTLWKIVDYGGKEELQAKVCERRKIADYTGGNHYLILLLDCEKPNRSILNKDLLEKVGVQAKEDELGYLNLEEGDQFENREYVDPDEALCDDLSDLDFNEEDFNEVDLGELEVFNADILAEDLKRTAPNLLEELANINAGVIHQEIPAPVDIKGSKEIVPPPKSPLGGTNGRMLNDSNAAKKDRPKNAQNGFSNDSDTTDWEAEGNSEGLYFGCRILPLLSSARPPSVMWSDDLHYVHLRLMINDAKQYFLQWSCNSIQFSSKVVSRLYHFDEQLRGTINPDSVMVSVKGCEIALKMRKACSGLEWDRLFAAKRIKWARREHKANGADSSDSDQCSLDKVNRAIKKMPLEKRRRQHKQEAQGLLNLPDVSSESDDSDREYQGIGSDYLF